MNILEITKLSRAVQLPELDFLLGVLHANGYGVNLDKEKSRQFLLKAAQGGVSLAQYFLGDQLLNEAQNAENWTAGKNWLRAAADKGVSVAAYRLGLHYRESPPPEQNESESVAWNWKAVELEFPLAEYLHGMFLETGYGGLTVDLRAAKYWYEKASEHGCGIATWRLADAYEKGQLNLIPNKEKSQELATAAQRNDEVKRTSETEDWISAAKNGDRFVPKLLAMAYREGIYGFPSDPEQAEYWEKRVADNER
ncbi:MAG: hypothetical protein A3I66_11010 [Burkholderiales bacterium RIFCSPLOWO2_02_FULL_57_36]|nr:MAG: hypothetical protein A3I66_11010 [Burkholderiales bacterium RIFCSPLOWO2_02_FULL_57_36]